MEKKHGLFTREIKIHPDFPDPDNPENPVDMAIAYILSAKNRAVTFRILIHDYCDENRDRLRAYTSNGVYLCDIASHSVYEDEGDNKISQECCYLGAKCHSQIHTGSGLGMLKLLQMEKEAEFWECMEKYFYSFFKFTPPSETKFETTNNYWDCECETNYIQHRSNDLCEWCGVSKENSLDSRVDEVAIFLGVKKENIKC